MSKTIFKDNKEPILPKGYENWKIESHTTLGEIDISKLSLHLEPEQKDGHIQGNKLRKKLKGKEVINANVLDYLLNNPELIPENWKGNYIFFWGTIYRHSDGDLCVRYLCVDGDAWGWGSRWLGGGFDGDRPAALASPCNLETKTSSDTLSLELRVEKLEEKMDKISKILILE